MKVSGGSKSSTVFVLGAGFSACQQFPLAQDLKQRTINFLEAERHSSYRLFLQSGNGGLPEGQFYAGLKKIDPRNSLMFEELIIELGRYLATASDEDPCWTTLNVFRIGCARLLWCLYYSIWRVETCYENFAAWCAQREAAQTNAILSFNWDLLAERALTDSEIVWSYSREGSPSVPLLKPHGSINWSGHLREEGLRPEYTFWQTISSKSKLSYDSREPLSNPFKQEINSDLRYMIFPGDSESPNDADLKIIWEEAAEIIAEREKIVFLGYSLPIYDLYSIEFFKRAAKGKQVEVYNPNEEHLKRFRSELGEHVAVHAERFEHCVYSRRAA
jgi:hypothetical protein